MTQSKFTNAARLPLLALCGAVIAACSQGESPKAPATPAEPIATTPAAPAVTNDWAKLASLTGQTPSESGLFDTSPIAASLKTLLGDRFDVFKANFLVESPLQADKDVLFTSGNNPSAGGSDQAYLLIHPETRALEVGLWEAGKLTTFKTQGASIPKPADIQTMISNAAP